MYVKTEASDNSTSLPAVPGVVISMSLPEELLDKQTMTKDFSHIHSSMLSLVFLCEFPLSAVWKSCKGETDF